jgi:trk system potassium uptake protein TrkH
MSAFLILFGAILIMFFEYNNLATIGGFSFKEKVYCAFFQSITARTAGFNTIAIDKLSGCSLVILIVLMFIGGSPGSTAGGIKTTTAAILFAIARAKILGIAKIHAFARTFPTELVEKAVTITVVAVIIVSIGAVLIYYSEYPYTPAKDTESFFIRSVFEATSAFATVGLSTGITPTLNAFGKIVLIVLMYIGRIGPLTLALALTEREIKSRIEYAEESVMIG